MFVFDFAFFLFRITLWSSAGKELSPWFSARTVLFYAVLIVCVPFSLDVWGRMWNSIVLVPDHCLLFNFALSSSLREEEAGRCAGRLLWRFHVLLLFIYVQEDGSDHSLCLLGDRFTVLIFCAMT